MATLATLSEPDGPLTAIRVPLKRGVQPLRCFYACPEFMGTLTGDFRGWTTGRLKAELSPQEQFDIILKKWIGGERMIYQRMIQDLRPLKDEVWEIKTIDLRIFGWIYRPCIFIAVLLEYADWYKTPTKRCTYDDARKRVLAQRERLDIDEPKYATGEFGALV
jgi:hypothetical protein